MGSEAIRFSASMRTEELRPPGEQLRTEIGGLEISPAVTAEFIEHCKELGLTERHQPVEGQHATVFFIPANQPIDQSVRYRVYGLSNQRAASFRLEPTDIGVFEIKIKPQRYPVRVEKKYRVSCTPETAWRAVQNLGAAHYILQTGRISQSGYPEGEIPAQVIDELCRKLPPDEIMVPSLTMVSGRTHLVADSANPDALRVTIDRGLTYWGFDYRHPETNPFASPEFIGVSPDNRVEVKVTQTDLDTGPILQLLEQLGHRPRVRKLGFQAYFGHYLGASGRFDLQPVYKVNELPGVEAEAKWSLRSGVNEDLIGEIYAAVNQDSEWMIHPQRHLRPVRESVTHPIRYGVKTAGGWKEAFVITPKPKERSVGIKRKEEGEEFEGVLFRKEELTTLDRWPEWTQYAEESVVAAEAARLGVMSRDIKRIGETERDKVRVYAEKRTTGRHYIISLDESKIPGGASLAELEIEYGGRTGMHAITGTVRREIARDILELGQVVVNVCARAGEKLEKTNKTKFDFLMEQSETGPE